MRVPSTVLTTPGNLPLDWSLKLSTVSLLRAAIHKDIIKLLIIDDTAFFKRLPVQVCKHSRDATVAGVVIKDKAGSSPLDRLNCKKISLAVCGDQARRVLRSWTD